MNEKQIKTWLNDQRKLAKNGQIDLARKLKLEKINGWHLIDTVSENKETLLAMAKNGENKPIQRKHQLGHNFVSYTLKKSRSYDANFTSKIMSLRPEWLSNTAKINKKAIIELAKNGGKKPKREDDLGCWRYYVNPNKNTYDKIFHEHLLKLAPKWFENAEVFKHELLRLAEKSKNRPVARSPLGMRLNNYVRVDGTSYDREFHVKIRTIAPKWFVNTATQNKDELIRMAKNKEPKPSYSKHHLGRALPHYINPKDGSYDASFNALIREFAPHWFK